MHRYVAEQAVSFRSVADGVDTSDPHEATDIALRIHGRVCQSILPSCCRQTKTQEKERKERSDVETRQRQKGVGEAEKSGSR
jgi:hypothetical protein